MTETSKLRPARFRAVLTPNRSLSQTGFLVLMAFVTLVNIVVGVAFLMLGAWPVFGFCGLDVLLIYWAFRVNYRSGRLSETIELDVGRLSLVRLMSTGEREQFEMNPYWTRVQIAESPGRPCRLTLTSHGRELPFATFLSDEERRELADVLRSELAALRAGGAIA